MVSKRKKSDGIVEFPGSSLSSLWNRYSLPGSPRFITFCLVGSMGGVIHLGMLYLLTEYVHVWYIFSAIIAFICAVIHNFILNKYWTFRDRTPYIYEQFVTFFIISCISLGIHLTVLYVLTEYLGIWYMLAQLIAILIGLSNNYLGNKKFTFTGKTPGREDRRT